MKLEKKTKIVATIGPASDSNSTIKELMLAGVNIFRFNTKHSDVAWHNERIKRVQKIANEMNENVGIMIDLQGNEIRIETREEKNIKVKKGDVILIASDFISEDIKIAISDKKVLKGLRAGDSLLIDDGMIELEVIESRSGILKAKVIDGGLIKNRKSINFPGTKIKLASLIKRDIENLDSAAKNNVTYVALSFVSSKEDIFTLRNEIKKREMGSLIVSKIENQESLDNLDEIIEASDAIMIARGDLGIEIPIEKLAFWQKEIIKKCRQNRKPVIVATQMLHSMINNSRPTRAEATDVANAVFDGADAVMLSEETAMGKFPVRSVIEMSKILKFNEDHSNPPVLKSNIFSPTEFVVGAIAREVEQRKILDKLKIKTAIIFTESGYTARVFSSFRTKIRIIAITNQERIAEELSLSYGITSYYSTIDFNDLCLPKEIIKDLKKKKVFSKNEVVAVFHGKYAKKPELINLFSLTTIK